MADLVEFDSEVLAGAPQVRLSRRALITGIAAGTVFPFISSCTTNPATGSSKLILFGEEQVASMAATAWTDMKSQTPVVSNSRLKNQVLSVWERTSDGAVKAGHIDPNAN